MSMSEAFEALRRANPRAGHDFNSSVGAAADTVRAQIAAAATPDLRTVRLAPRRRHLPPPSGPRSWLPRPSL